MKSRIITLLVLFCTLAITAQQAINYKALIKDNLGNVLANQSVTIQFTILQDTGGGTALVYQETHYPTTDANGIIIVNIGEGTTSYTFSDISWNLYDHFLNVQIDTGAGFTNIGTTQFMAVPYALNVTGLEKNGYGWTLIGRDSNNYGDIGSDALDLSFSYTPSDVYGATGGGAVAMGFQTEASGINAMTMGYQTEASGINATSMGAFTEASGEASTALGESTIASGDRSIAMGSGTTASGNQSTAMGGGTTASGVSAAAFGVGTTADDFGSLAVGKYNDYTLATNTLFQVGNGTYTNDLSNAFVVDDDGIITAPSFDIFEITDPKALITKEYLEANSTTATGLEALDEGNGSGWRLVGSDPANFGDIGTNAIDLSISSNPSSVNGATGPFSFALGNNAEASGMAAMAIGFNSKAQNSGAISIRGIVTGEGALAMAGGNASGQSSFAQGLSSVSSASFATAIGNGTTSSGDYAVALGHNTTSSGWNSFSSGVNTEASGTQATAMGAGTVASGHSSVAMGNNTIAEAPNTTAIGLFNVGGGDPLLASATDPLFEIGNGHYVDGVNDIRTNALTVLRNGTITAPTFDISEITNPKALITKEYADANYSGGGSGTSPTGLEALDEGNGQGWRLIGNNPVNYGDIGLQAVDLSYSGITSATNGATGAFSLASGASTMASGQAASALGNATMASGDNTTAMGWQSQAVGTASTSMGYRSVASGANAFAFGQDTQASGFRSAAGGYFTESTGNHAFAIGDHTQATASNAAAFGFYTVADDNDALVVGKFNDPSTTNVLFQVGNGATDVLLSNALNVFTNGTITAPSFDMVEITDPKALITKEYADANYSGGGSGTSSTGLETLDEGNGIGWRLIGRNPANYGAVGENAVDMSYNPDASEDFGALGTANFTAGYKTKATNLASTALGNETIASGFSTTALGFGTIADDQFSTVVGRLNDNTTATNILFQIGNGNTGGRSNAFNVDFDGVVTAPSFDISEITDPKALITKEYADANLSSTGLEALDEGNGTGWRLTGANPTYYGNIGSNAIDLSSQPNAPSATQGAIGEYSFASGYSTVASGAISTAVGYQTNATGNSSFAMGEVTYATGTASTAMGVSSGASGFASTAMGYIVNADDESSTVVGILNDETFSTTTLFQVGNGNNIGDRSNAFTVLQNGYSAFGTHNVEPNADIHLFHDNDGTLNGFKLQNKGTNENWWRFYTLNSNGQLYLYSKAGGNASPVGSFDDASGTYTALSDRRAKANFKDLYFNWQEFMQLQPLTYHYKSDENKKSHIGFVAQDVEPIYPELVNHNKEDDLYQLNYSGFGVVAIKAIQELKKENEQLKALLLKEKQASAKQSQVLQALLERVEALEKQQSNSSSVQLAKN